MLSLDWKLQIDNLPQKIVCWIITATALVLLFTGISTAFISPPLLLDNFGMNVCPNNDKGVRIVPFCRLFNLNQNKYWYSYTHRFSPVEHLLLVRAAPVLKVTTTVPLTYILKYSLRLLEIDDNFDVLREDYLQDYNEVSIHCPAGSRYCSTETLYLSASKTSGRYMVKIDLLNLAEVKDMFADISMSMIELNYGSSLFITLVKLLLLLITLMFLGRYVVNKRLQPNKLNIAEKLILVLGITLLFVNLPTAFISLVISSLGGNILFAISLITLGAVALLFWLKILEAPLQPEQNSPRLQLIDVLLIIAVWAGLTGGIIYYLYEYDRNPTFHLETK